MSDYCWLSNMRAPFSVTDQAFLDKLADYKIGAPVAAKDRETAYTVDQLNDFNIVGIYTTPFALSAMGDEAFSVAKARAQLSEPHTPLTSHLAKYLDDDLHFRPR